MTKTISKLLFDSLVVRFLSSHAMNCLSEVIASCFVLCGLFCPSRWRCRIWMQLKGWNCWCYLLNLVPNIYIFWERKRKTPIFSYQHTSSKLDMCMDFEWIKEKVWWRYYFWSQFIFDHQIKSMVQCELIHTLSDFVSGFPPTLSFLRGLCIAMTQKFMV